MHTLESLSSEVERRADESLDRVLALILDSPVINEQGCEKCVRLLRNYVALKLYQTRIKRRESYGDYPEDDDRNPASHGFHQATLREINRTANAVQEAREAFHAVDCTCGLQLWRSQTWRDKQPLDYQIAHANHERGNTKCL